MSEKIRCSVGILTFNSGQTLRRALESVKRFDDIIIADGGSMDDTLAIAAQYNARVVSQDTRCLDAHGHIRNFACAKNQLIKEACRPYLLIIDSDEAASPELVVELEHIAREGGADGYQIPIRMWWRGRIIEHASNYPGYQYRIVRTDRAVRMVKPVHERPVFELGSNPICRLSAPWYVYLDDEFVFRYMERNGKYVRRELEVLGPISLRHWLIVIVPNNLKSVLSIVLKTTWYRLWHTRAACMPLSVEWGRVRYHICLLRGALKNVCRF